MPQPKALPNSCPPTGKSRSARRGARWKRASALATRASAPAPEDHFLDEATVKDGRRDVLGQDSPQRGGPALLVLAEQGFLPFLQFLRSESVLGQLRQLNLQADEVRPFGVAVLVEPISIDEPW